MIKLVQGIDECREGVLSLHTAKDRFLDCTSRIKDGSRLPDNYKDLPRLGIVMSVTTSWASTHIAGLEAVTANFRCYAALHNYSFELNLMEHMSGARFFTARHQRVLKHFLPRYQHVLHVDADVLVLNVSRPLDAFLGLGHDVLLHMHENGEVTASTYLLRNSRYSRCFLRYWLAFGPPHPFTDSPRHAELTYRTLNYDNGDLVAALAELLDSRDARHCTHTLPVPPESENAYLDSVVPCFLRHVSVLAQTLQLVAPQVRVFLPREGFWRTHGRRGRFGAGSWWDDLYGSCFPSSDVLGHGWKAMARVFWGNRTDSCPASMSSDGSGAVQGCVWLSPAEELAVLNRFCAWRSPACTRTSFGAVPMAGESNQCLAGASCGRHSKDAFEKPEAFSISSESWIRQQMCASCPALAMPHS